MQTFFSMTSIRFSPHNCKRCINRTLVLLLLFCLGSIGVLKVNKILKDTVEFDPIEEQKYVESHAEMRMKPFVIVSGTSSNHFRETIDLIETIHTVLKPRYNSMKVVIFDLGLFAKEIEYIYKWCNYCNVTKFNFNNYPPHVKLLETYAWKPLIIESMVARNGLVMWVDSSIRFIKRNVSLIDDLLNSVTDNNPMYVLNNGGSIRSRTKAYTFKALGADPEDFRDRYEVSANWMIIKSCDKSRQHIMKPWTDCAVTLGCMTTMDEKRVRCPEPSGKIGDCHRFDQSVLGIILYQLYKGNSKEFVFFGDKYGTVKRRDIRDMLGVRT